MNRKSISLILLLAVLASYAVMGEETKEERDARMHWWRDAKFGMFIHWGVYSVPAGYYHDKLVDGIGEWIMNNGKIPVAEYRAFARDFNPVKYDPEAWVLLAKNAGMKYIVITSKHHDGFALFDSKATEWDVVNATPYGKDLLKPLAEACRKHGMKLGFYYSQAQDWNHPGGGNYGGCWDKAQEGDMTEYIKKIAVPQVTELLSNYGDVVALWWDTPANMTKERAELFQPALKLQPKIITNNRLGGGFEGDTETPEQFIPANGYPGRDWETCMTMNNTWGYKKNDLDWKSTESLVRNLIDIISKGGNYLLNVGPTAEGEIPSGSVARLKEVGEWVQLHKEAIYESHAGPFSRQLPWGRCTTKPGKLFLHVFDWPQPSYVDKSGNGKLHVPITNKVKKAYPLTQPKKQLAFAAAEDGVLIDMPSIITEPIATTIVLEIEGEPQTLVIPILPEKNGTLKLRAVDAKINGQAKLEGDGDQNIGFWTHKEDTLEWDAKINSGSYQVDLVLACDDGAAGSEFQLSAGSAVVTGKTPATGGYTKYQTVKAGTLAIDKAGMQKFVLKPVTMPNGVVMDLRTVTLTPVKN